MTTQYFCLLFFFYSFFYVSTPTHAQKLRVALIGLEDLDPLHLDITAEAISSFYEAEVRRLSVKLPVDTSLMAFKTWGDEKQLMQQFNALAINARIAESYADQYDFIIALTDSALTIGKKYTGWMIIRGLAQDELQAATISTYKIKRESADSETFVDNLSKLARHEVGHLLGLPHCEDSEACLMLNGFHFDKIIQKFCDACLGKIDKRYLLLSQSD
jgi:archaemetzincin